MFDTIIKKTPIFVMANEKSWHNLSRYHKVGIFLNIPPNKWDFDSKFVMVGFYSEGESLIAHGNSEAKLVEFMAKLMEAYNG